MINREIAWLRASSRRSRIEGARIGSRLVALAAAATWSITATAQPSALSEAEQWDRMIAPAPQRELARAWQRCVTSVRELLLAQGGTVEQFRALALGGCANEESRLTGVLVREFGYDRANRAVAAAKERLSVQFADAASRRGAAPPNANFVERTSDGWVIERNADQCTARLRRSTVFGTMGAIIQRTPQGEALLLIELGSDARSRARYLRDGEPIEVPAYVTGRRLLGLNAPNVDVRLSSLPLTVGVVEQGYGFLTPMTPQLASALANATSIQIRVDIGPDLARPHDYPLAGFTAARAAVRSCTQR